jgi:GT2 family glycosyltransferase
VFAQTQPPDEVVVVDNGSTDDSVALIRARYPSIYLVERLTNEGFARGNNLGIQQACGDYILILNTDVFLDRDFLCRACQVMQRAPDIGSVAAKIYKADTDVIDYVGVYIQPWLKVVNGLNVANPEDVFAGSGAALCWEDMDLAWRAHLRKWRCVFAPDVIGHHLGSASQGGKVRTLSKPAFVQRHIWKNRYLIVTKNTSFLELLVLLPFLFLGELLHWLMILFRVPNRLPLFVLSHIDFLKLLPKVLRQRQVIQRRRLVGAWAILKFFRF